MDSKLIAMELGTCGVDAHLGTDDTIELYSEDLADLLEWASKNPGKALDLARRIMGFSDPTR